MDRPFTPTFLEGRKRIQSTPVGANILGPSDEKDSMLEHKGLMKRPYE